MFTSASVTGLDVWATAAAFEIPGTTARLHVNVAPGTALVIR